MADPPPVHINTEDDIDMLKVHISKLESDLRVIDIGPQIFFPLALRRLILLRSWIRASWIELKEAKEKYESGSRIRRKLQNCLDSKAKGVATISKELSKQKPSIEREM
ncbi:hypothetical protein AAE478_001962 [Parahypoxylon ruwenzoriense]